eukprot:96629-Rhodomonas_salina.1
MGAQMVLCCVFVSLRSSIAISGIASDDVKRETRTENDVKRETRTENDVERETRTADDMNCR